MEIGCLGSGDGNIIVTRLEPDPIRIESSRGALQWFNDETMTLHLCSRKAAVLSDNESHLIYILSPLHDSTQRARSRHNGE